MNLCCGRKVATDTPQRWFTTRWTQTQISTFINHLRGRSSFSKASVSLSPSPPASTRVSGDVFRRPFPHRAADFDILTCIHLFIVPMPLSRLAAHRSCCLLPHGALLQEQQPSFSPACTLSFSCIPIIISVETGHRVGHEPRSACLCCSTGLFAGPDSYRTRET